MALHWFLAMTDAEIADNPDFSGKQAWLGCRFSPFSSGLADLPARLKPGTLLTVNDSLPFRDHDPKQIARELSECISRLSCCAVLLDFQKPDCSGAAGLAEFLLKALPCPVIVSEMYARELDCPVFLPPVQPSVPLNAHLSSWSGRDIWLDISSQGEQITLTEDGAIFSSLPRFIPEKNGHREQSLHCHYTVETGESIRFTLWRTEEDLKELVEEAEGLGIAGIIGLYQELVHTGYFMNV